MKFTDSIKPSDKVAVFSSDVDFKELGMTICAMSNSGGGTIYIGIEKVGENHPGIIKIEEFEKRLRVNLLHSKDFYKPAITPQAYWSLESEKVGNTNVILLNIPSGVFVPYAMEGEIFIRKDKINQKADAMEIDHLVNQRYLGMSRWGTLPVLDKEINDLDESLILETAKIANKKRLYEFSNLEDPFSILDNLNLLFQGRISNFAYLLFGKNPERTFPQSRIRVISYIGKKIDLNIGTDKFIEGNLLKQYELVTEYIKNQIPTFSELTSFSDTRKDELAYPYWSVREGIRNAIIHRNYETATSEMRIEIFAGKISIWSYGGLPVNLKIKDLANEHPSLPPNPEIAHVFFLKGIIEKLGRGTQRIVKEFKDHGLAAPKWEEIGGGIKLTMHGKIAGSAILESFNARQLKAIDSLKPGEMIKATDYNSLVGEAIADRTARVDIKALVDAGYLKQQGKGQNTVYIRTDKN